MKIATMQYYDVITILRLCMASANVSLHPLLRRHMRSDLIRVIH